MTTTWVEMYHPALPGTPHIRSSSQAVAENAARGWLVVDGTTPAPTDIYLTPGVGDLRYAKTTDVGNPATTTGAALKAAFVSQLKGTGTADSAAIMAAFNAMKVGGHATGTLKLVGSFAVDTDLVLDGGYASVSLGANWTAGSTERFVLDASAAVLVPASGSACALTVKGFYGAKVDVAFKGGGTRTTFADGAITSGSAVLTSATAAAAAVVGRFVRVRGAGTNGEAPLCARVVSVAGNNITLDTTASATIASGGVGAIESVALHLENLIQADVACDAIGYAGLMFHHDAPSTATAVTQSTIRRLRALSCGQGVYLAARQGSFGVIEDVWDDNCVDGSVLSNSSDLQLVHWESFAPSSQDVSLIIDKANNMSAASINLGDSATEALLKIVGGDVGHIDSIYCTSGAANKDGVKFVEVKSIDVDRMQTNTCAVGLHIKGGGASGIRIKNQVSLTGDTVGTKLEAGPATSYMEMVDIHGYWNFTGSEAVRVESSVTGGRIKLRGQVDSTVNQSGGAGKYTVDCQASSAVLDVQGLTQLANNGTVAGGVRHVATANLLGTDQARLGNGPAPLTPPVTQVANANNLSLASSTTETVLIATTIKASSISAGAQYKIKARGTFDNIATSGSITIRDKHGTQVMFFLSLGSYASAQTGAVWEIELDVIYTTVGSSAAIVTNGVYRSTITGDTQRMARGNTTGNTTVDQDLALTVQWATSNAGNVWRTDTATIEKVA